MKTKTEFVEDWSIARVILGRMVEGPYLRVRFESADVADQVCHELLVEDLTIDHIERREVYL